ncbi:MAG: dihydroorotate dehydrogenase-like protein [Alphaproteobacteria bacterium]|jgi:dihydroorotate dehydrogenase (fumarate)|nr:dihydroorotate dehydrogenase-like protein [Alphaproteobacteria bacterium]
MDLKTKYLGLELASPIMPGASPMPDDLDTVRQLEDAGAAAIVMHSLFEEQLVGEQLSAYSATEPHAESFGEALSYLPEPDEFHLGPEEYLDHVRRAKEAVGVPVIASLNGATLGGWLEHAKEIAAAGADALELNIYDMVTDPRRDSASVEQRLVDIVRLVKKSIDVPVAVKLAPFYTSMANLAGRLDAAGADGIILFNRLYQPDIDTESLELLRMNPVGLGDLSLRLRWLGILRGQVNASLAASGGVSTATEVAKALMAGADVAQMVSALLLNGPQYLAVVEQKLVEWLEENEYHSLEELRSSMSMHRCPDPSAYTRTNYMRTLLSWRM